MKYKSAKMLNKPRGWIYGAKWADYPCEARVCLVTVGAAPQNWWCAKLVGEERSALEIVFPNRPDQTLYIDNEDDWALSVMLRGLAPVLKFRYMPVFRVQDDSGSEVFYKAKVG